MAKKQRIKNEDPSINFRLSPEMKKWVINEAISKNVTVSNYLRNHLEKFIDGTLYDEFNQSDDHLPFLKSIEFLQLITFVFSKRENSKCTSTQEQLSEYIKTIKQMSNEDLPSKIISEFDKVLMDLIKVKNENKKLSYVHFEFCKTSYLDTSFKYKLLEKYLLNEVKAIPQYFIYS
ncbi:hypothetical protein [Lutibacter citreus]|uniref:hypothetical protein n=1 Tax=Lutibacter citreus TaxID=2138210 RepID=UPI000DBE537C|nr:hypothetical protein [Lutibacter citreus]